MLIEVLVCLVVVAGTAWGQQSEPLVTDRPDLTESSSVVGEGMFQLETSFQWEKFETGPFEERSVFTPTLLRLGVTDRLELRLASGALSHVSVSLGGGSDDGTLGYSPLSFGAKYLFMDADPSGGIPSLGAILHVEIPSGSGAFSTEDVAISFVVAADWDLSDRWSLGVNGGGLYADDDVAGSETWGLVTSALGFGITDQTGAFVELAVDGLGLEKDARAVIFDAGVTNLITNGMQVDAALGSGLTDETNPDFFVTVGFSLRVSAFSSRLAD